MIRKYRLLAAIAVIGVLTLVAPCTSLGKGPEKGAHGKGAHHKSGQQMLGDKIKTNGKHQIDKVGEHTVSVNVSNGKVAGVSVRHSTKGDVPVTKYKTHQKMARRQTSPYTLVQYDLGTTYIGYAFIDDYGDEQIYWFPYEMILDGDTGAIDYVPLS
jgi:hypothetical protein